MNETIYNQVTLSDAPLDLTFLISLNKVKWVGILMS
jgi:hypothetical protein